MKIISKKIFKKIDSKNKIKFEPKIVTKKNYCAIAINFIMRKKSGHSEATANQCCI